MKTILLSLLFSSFSAHAALSPLFVSANQLQHRAVSATAPTNGQVLTWNTTNSDWEPAAGGGGGGADVHLSNISATTIPAFLIFQPGFAGQIKTANNASGTETMRVLSGDSTNGNTGSIYVFSGSTNDGSSTSGNVNVGSGNAGQTNASTGNLTLSTGNGLGSGSVGDILIIPGTGDNATSGNIILNPQSATGSGAHGHLYFQDGSEGTTGFVWTATDSSGRGAWMASTGGADIHLSNVSSTSIPDDLIFDSTHFLRATTNPSTGYDLNVLAGHTTDVGGTMDAGNLFLTGGSASNGNRGGQVDLFGGQGNNGQGGTILLTSGDSNNAAAGDIAFVTGTGFSTRGKIQIQDGSEGTSGYVLTSTDTVGTATWMPAGGGSGSSSRSAQIFIAGPLSTSGTPSQLPFTAGSMDTGTHWTTGLVGTNHFVALKTGIHRITASGVSDDFTTQTQAVIFLGKNGGGASIELTTVYNVSPFRSAPNGSILMDLTAGDTVEFFYQVTSSGTENMVNMYASIEEVNVN